MKIELREGTKGQPPKIPGSKPPQASGGAAEETKGGKAAGKKPAASVKLDG